MDDPLRLISETEGVFLRREALDCGYTDKWLAAMVRRRVVHRVRQGAYCFTDVWTTLKPEERHLVLARAVLRTTPGPVALSHTTALLAHGVAVWGTDLTKVHVTRLDTGSCRSERDVEHHVGLCTGGDVTLVGGLPVTEVDRAVIETASISRLESGLVSADSALHRRMCTPEVLRERFRMMNHWPGSQKIHLVMRHMDGRAESVGETRARYMCWRYGFPIPDLQFEVYDETGVLVARTDFVWHRYKRFGEFDGRVKYGRLVEAGEEPGDVVFREKQREDLVRRLTGYGGVRWIWRDLDNPRNTLAWTARQFGL